MLDAQELVVAAAGSINVAKLSDNPTLPAATDSPGDPLDAKFAELGYTTDDGFTFTVTPTIDDITAWQAASPIRRLVTARAVQGAFSLQQWNQDTFALAFGGGEWSEPAPGVFRYDPPADTDPITDYALVVDFADGTRKARAVILKGSVNDAVETQLVRTGPAVLPVTFAGLAPEGAPRSWYFVGDDEAAFGDFS